MSRFSPIFAIIAMILTAGCSTGKFDDKYYGTPEKKLFDMAQNEVANERYPEAVEMFESFDSQYPTSVHSEQALAEYIYAQYKVEEYAVAVAASDRFLKLYPRSKKADYILYLKGIINSSQERTIFDDMFKEDLSTRDTTFFKEAYNDFEVLVNRFPKSPYAQDARHRMLFIRNLLAQSELNIAKYYFSKKLYVAAVNRAVYIVENYSQAPQALDALKIILKSNKQMDFKRSARDALKIISLTYPKMKELREYDIDLS